MKIFFGKLKKGSFFGIFKQQNNDINLLTIENKIKMDKENKNYIEIVRDMSLMDWNLKNKYNTGTKIRFFPPPKISPEEEQAIKTIKSYLSEVKEQITSDLLTTPDHYLLKYSNLKKDNIISYRSIIFSFMFIIVIFYLYFGFNEFKCTLFYLIIR
jgi:hypothetical protein